MKYLENICFHNCSEFPAKMLKNKIEMASLRSKLLKFPIEKLQEIKTEQSRKLL